jgi:hypothetical protein
MNILPLQELNFRSSCGNLGKCTLSLVECIQQQRKLHELKLQYQALEDNYFQLESLRQNKQEELEKVLNIKEEEKEQIEALYGVYENHSIQNLSLNQLKDLEKKIFKGLLCIKSRKQEGIFVYLY